MNKEDEINFQLLSLLAAKSEMPMLGANIASGMVTGLLNNRVNGILPEINQLYVDYKAGHLTKGQYDYRRKLKIQELKTAIGPLINFYLEAVQTMQFVSREAAEYLQLVISPTIPIILRRLLLTVNMAVTL